MSVVETIEVLFSRSAKVSTREVAEAAGVSRQGAQKQLKAMVARGALSVQGKARAARYSKTHRVDALWAKVAQLGEVLGASQPAFHAQARFPVDERVRARLEVASAGAVYRLSARLLLSECDAQIVELDFNGVEDVGDEFLDEVFCVWAARRPDVSVQVSNVAEGISQKVRSARG